MPFSVVSKQWRQRRADLMNGDLVDLTRLLPPEEGFSVSDLGLKLPTTGYFVAISAYGAIYDRPTFSVHDLQDYVANFRSFLQGSPDRYLGAWVDGDEVYLDISEWIADRDTAIMDAKNRGELAVWDIARKESITVNKGIEGNKKFAAARKRAQERRGEAEPDGRRVYGSVTDLEAFYDEIMASPE